MYSKDGRRSPTRQLRDPVDSCEAQRQGWRWGVGKYKQPRRHICTHIYSYVNFYMYVDIYRYRCKHRSVLQIVDLPIPVLSGEAAFGSGVGACGMEGASCSLEKIRSRWAFAVMHWFFRAVHPWGFQYDGRPSSSPEMIFFKTDAALEQHAFLQKLVWCRVSSKEDPLC